MENLNFKITVFVLMTLLSFQLKAQQIDINDGYMHLISQNAASTMYW